MDKASRPVRNRRHNRRVWPPGDTHRPVKRLFTPEIKRMLKDWLVRRRDNPYPSRDEKKTLAYETGLTYTQICNWFANWRRKLKNSGREPTKKTWGHLIKNYNVNAKGNVEQFSICSSDSIWGDDERSLSNRSNSPTFSINENNNDNNYPYITKKNKNSNKKFSVHEKLKDEYKNFLYNNKIMYQGQNESAMDHYYTSRIDNQCFQISSTTIDADNNQQNSTALLLNRDNNNDEILFNNKNQIHPFSNISTVTGSCSSNNTKYKQQIMEKYLRDNNSSSSSGSNSNKSSSTSSPELSKWITSTQNFTPNKNNYIDWNKSEKKQLLKLTNDLQSNCANFSNFHQKEELDAAEALANLACNFRQKLINPTSNYLSTY